MAVVPVPFVAFTSALSSTTYTGTVSVTTPQGAALVAVVGSSGGSACTGVTDTQGNTYTLATQSITNENVQCFVALAANPLVAGVDNITATYGTANTLQKNIIGVYVQGAILTDLAATNNGLSTSASVTGGTPAYGNELAIAIIQGGNSASTFTPPLVTGNQPYVAFSGLFPGGAQATSLYYQWLPVPSAQTLTSTLSASQQWAFLLVTFFISPLAQPSVPNFLAGFGPQQSDLQSLWTSPAGFMQQRPAFRAVQSHAATTLPSSGAATRIAYDTVLEDPYGGWQPGTHVWLAPVSGWYHVTVTVCVAAPTAGSISLQPSIGCTAASQNTGALVTIVMPQINSGAEGSYYVYLNAGQDSVWGAGAVLNAAANQTTSLAAGQQSSIEVVWITA